MIAVVISNLREITEGCDSKYNSKDGGYFWYWPQIRLLKGELPNEEAQEELMKDHFRLREQQTHRSWGRNCPVPDAERRPGMSGESKWRRKEVKEVDSSTFWPRRGCFLIAVGSHSMVLHKWYYSDRCLNRPLWLLSAGQTWKRKD